MRLLVANRGEIALRIFRACRDLGIETVAVFSDADRTAPHVAAADYAVRLGPAPAAESYLSVPALLAAARKTGAGLIHPGYGFLAENAGFARACVEAGLIFVGPTPEAIDAMGSKTESRERMRAAGVPIVPGMTTPAKDASEIALFGKSAGYPLLLKASAGGGGKGMRRVENESETAAAFARASSEAKLYFGDGAVYAEKLIERPRHVEVQVVGDCQGRIVAVGERECSVQRRHQKVIEECPSPVVGPALRARLSEAAVAAARAVGYTSCGTVEFLLASDGSFYFLEMNTRLQVEHPVTEEVWGVDLAAEMIR
ncbi:MAG: biotin carboxylase N-terminal domain-containing protein, partial [Acidobacteriota bacterium]